MMMMEGAGIFTAALVLLVLPLALAVALLVDILKVSNAYKNYWAMQGPREAALADASHGAAMIVLPLLALLRYGGDLPSWATLAALAAMFWGSLRLSNGAKFSVGWRDPKLITRAGIKIGLAVLLFRAIDARQLGNLGIDALLSFVGWWLLVTGITKLLLVLRGFPSAPWDGQPLKTPHGNAPFTDSSDAAKGLKK